MTVNRDQLLNQRPSEFTFAQWLELLTGLDQPGPSSSDTSIVNVKSKGAIADGASHPLSEGYLTLGSAQADFPFVTSLSQELDYCACKKASNEAFGGDLEILTAYRTVSQASDDTHIHDATQNWAVNEHAGKTAFRRFTSNNFVTSVTILSNTATVLTLAAPMPSGAIGATNEYAIGYGEHGSNSTLNKPWYAPHGDYWFGNDTLLIRNAKGIHMYGDAREATNIRGNNTVLAFDGLWYSRLELMSLLSVTPDAIAALEIDGNIPGQPYATRGVQGNTLSDLLIDGGGSLYAFTMTRQGGSSGQGSENKYDNIHLSNTTFACYYQNGFNALANTFTGGNCQNYLKHGLYAVGGTFNEYGMGFQSTHGYKQIENDGADVRLGDAGAYESCVIDGSRTESLVFLYNAGAVLAGVSNCVGRSALPGWFAATTYGALAASYKAIIEGGRLFVATTEGITGGSKPNFAGVATGGTIADNTIVWTETPFDAIYNGYGQVDKNTVGMSVGNISARPKDILVCVASDWDISFEDYVLIDCTLADRVANLPSVSGIDLGRVVTVKKTDTSAHTLTINGQYEGGGTTLVISGSARGARTLVWSDDTPGGARSWHLVGSV